MYYALKKKNGISSKQCNMIASMIWPLCDMNERWKEVKNVRTRRIDNN